jgi:hypothetical protein
MVQSEISHQPRFSDAEKTAIGKLRADIQRNCVKTRQNPKGAKVGYMDPRYLEVPLQTPKKKTKQDDNNNNNNNNNNNRNDSGWGGSTATKSVKWICMPYFVLQQYSGLMAASTTSLFPSQTLLQAQYSRSTQQRDMDQAVCQLGTAKKGECFHIAQLWCLVVGNSGFFRDTLESSETIADWLGCRLSCDVWNHVADGNRWGYIEDQL